jgi:acyl-CoA synthetase (AMP-forming)/AMP-acid ligase II
MPPSPARSTDFVGLIRDHAAVHPKRAALTFLEGGETEVAGLTYYELDGRAREIAAALQTAAEPGDRVLLLYPPGLEFVHGFLGCLYAGMVAVPAYLPRPNRQASRLRAIAADCGAVLALTTRVTLAALGRRTDWGDGVLRLEWIATDGGAVGVNTWAMPALGPGSLAFLQYTSGSTGEPKGVMVTHGNLLANLEMIRVAYGLDDKSVFVSWLPLFHDMGLIGSVLAPLSTGGRTVLMEPPAFVQKPIRWLRAVSRYRATISGGPNSAYDLCTRVVTDSAKNDLDLSSWRIAFNGAEPVRAGTVRAFAEAFQPCGFDPSATYPCYGLAEATLFVAGGAAGHPPTVEAYHARALESGRAEAPYRGSEARTLVASGRAWLGQQVLVVDPETHRTRPDGHIGEIWTSGPNVTKGYWGRPDETNRVFGAVPADGSGAHFLQGLRITIAKLGYMGSFVSRTNSNFCRTVLRLSDSVVSNTAHCYLRTII